MIRKDTRIGRMESPAELTRAFHLSRTLPEQLQSTEAVCQGARQGMGVLDNSRTEEAGFELIPKDSSYY